jgi:hypothetical protein
MDENFPRLPITVGFVIICGGLAIIFSGFPLVPWLFVLLLAVIIAWIWRDLLSDLLRAFFDALFRTRKI